LIGVQELHHTVGLGISERLEQDGVHDGEDGSVDADAEGDGGDGGDGEGWVRHKRAEGVAEVLPEINHDGTAFSYLVLGNTGRTCRIDAQLWNLVP
jgi:hypothetical protein